MGVISDSVRDSSRIGTVWGFAIVIMGLLAIMAPHISSAAVTSFVAILLTAAGLTATIYAFKAGSFGKGLLQFLFGGVTILAGVAMFLMPMVSMFTLTGILMVYFVVDGVFTLIGAFKAKPLEGWGWVAFSGAASIALAVLLYKDWPASGNYAVGLLVGVRLVFTGWSIAMLGMVGDDVSDDLQAAGDEIRAAADQQN